MKKIKLLLLLTLPLGGYAATDSTAVNDSAKVKKWELGLAFSPDYCYRKLKASADAAWISEARDSMEIAKFGYTTGISLACKLNPKIYIETGLLFSDSGEKTKKIATEEVPFGQKAVEYSFNHHFYYLDVPLRVDYAFLNGKLKFYALAGISANFLLSQKNTTITNFANNVTRETSAKNTSFSKFNLAVIAGCGIKYPLNKKATLKAEPIFRYAMTSVIDAPVKSYLYSAGVNIGFFYNL